MHRVDRRSVAKSALARRLLSVSWNEIVANVSTCHAGIMLHFFFRNATVKCIVIDDRTTEKDRQQKTCLCNDMLCREAKQIQECRYQIIFSLDTL